MNYYFIFMNKIGVRKVKIWEGIVKLLIMIKSMVI